MKWLPLGLFVLSPLSAQTIKFVETTGLLDNTDVVDLIESRMGLLAMLNEECVCPKGSDREFVYKAISENSKNAALIVDKMSNGVESIQ